MDFAYQMILSLAENEMPRLVLFEQREGWWMTEIFEEVVEDEEKDVDAQVMTTMKER